MSDLDLVCAPGETDWAAQSARLVAMLRRATLRAPPAPMPQPHSFFLSLTFRSLLPGHASLPPALWENTDCVELRADLLGCLDPAVPYASSPDKVRAELQKEIAALRSACPLPILFTIRSKAQGGAFERSNDECDGGRFSLTARRGGLSGSARWTWWLGEVDLVTRRSGLGTRWLGGGASRGRALLLNTCLVLRAGTRRDRHLPILAGTLRSMR